MIPEYIDGEEDFYNQEVIQGLGEDDALSIEEEGFMMDYLCS